VSAVRKPEPTPPPKTTARLVPAAPIDTRYMRTPLIVEGIEGPLETRMLTPAEFHKITVDQVTYQRFRTSIVTEIMYALKSKGTILDPLSIAVRADGSWWLVDGLQRYIAASECDASVPVVFYKSTGARAEAMLFQLLNSRVAVTADAIVKSHQGPGAEMLRETARDPGAALGGIVYFGGTGRTRRHFSAYIVLRGMLACATGTLATGKVQHVCARLDYALRAEPAARIRCEGILRLLPVIFPGDHPAKILPITALGRVAFQHWRLKVRGPSARSIRSIAGINWESLARTRSVAWLPTVEAAIEKRWRD
jgi:hypothetical protein